nr:ribonuclease H-like domain-containing protein [Tanacetum cinerariifolium]
MVSSLKLPILKKGEHALWSMRMEQYLTNTDYGLWQLIMNGDEPIQITRDENGDETEDAKSLWTAIKSRFGGNVESKKIQKTVLKQKFENFSVSDTEGLDKAYDRFQKLISLLEVHGAAVSNEDANQKFLRALPSSWNNIALIMRNKEGIDALDIDDLYNNLKVFEADIKGHNSSGQASSSLYTDNIRFSFFASQSNSPQLDVKDLEQIDHDDLEEMDLKWQVDMLFMRVKRFYKKTGRKLNFNNRTYRAPRNQGNKNGDARYRNKDNNKRTIPVESSDALVIQGNALIVQDGLGYDWSYIAQEEPTEFALMAYTSGSDTDANLEIVAYQSGLEFVEAQLIVQQKNKVAYEEKITVLEFKVKDKDKTGLGYEDQLSKSDSEVLPSVIDSHSSDGDDNLTNDRPTANKASASISKGEPSVIKTSNISAEMPKVHSVRTSGVIIEDWVRNDEDTLVDTQVDSQTTVKPSFKKIEFTKARNEYVKSDKQADKPKMIAQNSKADRKNWNGILTQKPRDMIRNKALLTNYQDIDGGFVAFGGSTKGGKITAKAIIDESNLWHRRLGHVNFKTMNKLMKGNLVRGLPSKTFENNHTRVACQKGKQHSLLEMDEFYGQKGIKREYSIARTPQQNGVAERKNKTLIEAAKTMLADSLLPTMFWAEAVNTACYVLNRVLVTKPHNKTPYELIIGRPPIISFMRPFGCLVTILNTLDPLGKFNGKAEEGFLVGY